MFRRRGHCVLAMFACRAVPCMDLRRRAVFSTRPCQLSGVAVCPSAGVFALCLLPAFDVLVYIVFCTSVRRREVVYVLPVTAWCGVLLFKNQCRAAGDQGRAQVRARHWRREEAASLQTRHGRTARDSQVPEEHRAADPEAAVPAIGE